MSDEISFNSFTQLEVYLKSWRSFGDSPVYDAVGMMALFEACLENMRRHFTEENIDQFAATIAATDRELLQRLVGNVDEPKDTDL